MAATKLATDEAVTTRVAEGMKANITSIMLCLRSKVGLVMLVTMLLALGCSLMYTRLGALDEWFGRAQGRDFGCDSELKKSRLCHRHQIALMVMTKDDLPMLSRWLIYHGHLFGFEHLYVFDGSTGAQKAWIEQAAKRYPFSVRHSLDGLDQLEPKLKQWILEISSRYEWIAKLDTDEFVTHSDGVTLQASSSLLLPSGNVAPLVKVDWHFLAEQVAAGPPTETEYGEGGQAGNFKQLYSGPRYQTGTFNLGSHDLTSQVVNVVKGLTIVHYHARSYAEMVRIAMQVIISHKYITETDSRDMMLAKLTRLDTRPLCPLPSCHKAWVVLDDLKNRSKMQDAYNAKIGLREPILRDWRNFLRKVFSMYPSLLREHE